MAAIYFMINPSKASYSMAPTMIVCATVGLFDGDDDKRHKLVAPSLGCDSGRLLHGIGGLVQASKPSARRWLFLVLLTLATRSAKSVDVTRLALFGVRLSSGDGANASFKLDQCRKCYSYDLRRSRCSRLLISASASLGSISATCKER